MWFWRFWSEPTCRVPTPMDLDCQNREESVSRRFSSLRCVVGEYVKHYHLERNHQGLGNEPIEPSSETGQGRVACRQRLGGLVRYYYRRAA
jgi:hypothetical protein